MFFNTNLTRLNFHYDEINKVLIDKKLGLKISLGLVSGLRGIYGPYQNINQGFALCIQEQGIPQNELDRICSYISEDANIEMVDILLTKSDLPFDNRWYVMGNIRGLIEAARRDKIRFPLSHYMCDTILIELEDYEDKESI